MKKFVIIFLIEIIYVVLLSLGIIPKEFSLLLTALLLIYIIFAPLEESIALSIVSIPLYIALPLTQNFDSMANWRILIFALFLTSFLKQGFSLKKEEFWSKLKTYLFGSHYQKLSLECLAGIFILISFLSLFVARYPLNGLEKIIFLVNIGMLYLVIKNNTQTKEKIIRIVKAGVLGTTITLLVGFGQLISVFKLSLYSFWQWWASQPISVFYGKNLSQLLSQSNAWFSYYAGAPPTLRMFSVFPDSHSFAMFCIISLVFLLTLLFWFFKRKYKLGVIVSSILLGLCLLAIIFSGSRGTWLSAGGTTIILLGIIIYFKIREFFLKQKKVFQIILSSFILFFLLFPISSLILGWSQHNGEATGEKKLVFERAKSITDISEFSNRSRMEIWKKSLNSIKSRPWLGVGIGNYPLILDEDISVNKQGASAHNLYLDIASEIGIFGLFVVLAIFLVILKTAFDILRNSEDKIFQIFAGAFCIYTIWILGYSLVDVVLLNDKVLLFFMVALGILFGIQRLSLAARKDAVIFPSEENTARFSASLSHSARTMPARPAKRFS